MAGRRMTSTPRRFAELVFAFSERDLSLLRVDGLSDIELLPDPGGAIVIVSSGEMRPDPAEMLLQILWDRSRPLVAAVDHAQVEPQGCLLRVVEYVGPDDAIGAGIPIDALWVRELARFSGDIDLDIYVDADDRGGPGGGGQPDRRGGVGGES